MAKSNRPPTASRSTSMPLRALLESTGGKVPQITSHPIRVRVRRMDLRGRGDGRLRPDGDRSEMARRRHCRRVHLAVTPPGGTQEPAGAGTARHVHRAPMPVTPTPARQTSQSSVPSQRGALKPRGVSRDQARPIPVKDPWSQAARSWAGTCPTPRVDCVPRFKSIHPWTRQAGHPPGIWLGGERPCGRQGPGGSTPGSKRRWDP